MEERERVLCDLGESRRKKSGRVLREDSIISGANDASEVEAGLYVLAIGAHGPDQLACVMRQMMMLEGEPGPPAPPLSLNPRWPRVLLLQPHQPPTKLWNRLCPARYSSRSIRSTEWALGNMRTTPSGPMPMDGAETCRFIGWRETVTSMCS